MRKLVVFFLCLCVFPALSFTTKKVIHIQHWNTKAGARVYFVKLTNLPMLDVRVIFSAGSAYDGKMPGLASLTSNLIGQGTSTQNANKIAEIFDNIGTKFGATIDRDKSIVSLRSLTRPEYLKVALAEFSQVLTKAVFPQKAIRRVKNQTIAALNVQRQEPGSIAKNVFYKTVYGDQPYAHNPLGEISSINRIAYANIQTFYKRYYVAKNANIILVGNLDVSQAKRMAEQISSALPIGKPAARLQLATPLQHDIHRHIQFATKQAAIILGQVGINRNNPDYFPLIVGNYVFGGLPLGSILFKKVRDQRGLAYDASSVFDPLQYRGPFFIQLNTRVSKAKEALTVVKDALEDFLEQGPTEKQLNAAKQNLLGSFPLAFASNDKIAAVVSNMAFYHRPLNYLDMYSGKVRSVTPEQVKKAFRKLIHVKQLLVVTVGPPFQK